MSGTESHPSGVRESASGVTTGSGCRTSVVGMTTTSLDQTPGRTAGRTPRWAALALPLAAVWSLTYLGLGIAWLSGAGGNPADPGVDPEVGELSLLGLFSPGAGAGLLTLLAALGVACTVVLIGVPAGPVGPGRAARRAAASVALGLGMVLAVLLPDYRLLANVAYTPILAVLWVFGAVPEEARPWTWPVVNMGLSSLAGVAWFAAALVARRRDAAGCVACGHGPQAPAWTSGRQAARWGGWATAIAVAVPVGYALTRFAWALGIPFGVSQELLDELGNGVYAGAALATLAVGGAVLTLGLVQRWGEVFPRWMPGVHGRRVPIALAVVPAAIVSLVVTSAGLMFVRLGLLGRFAVDVPGEELEVAAWLPEMFWPLWGAALAAATYAYWLRRRGTCRRCG